MSLPNSDINGFTRLTSLMPGGNVPVQDPLTGVTYKFDLSTLLGAQSSDFRWIADHNYDEGNIVSYGGSLWESEEDDNVGNIPVEGSAHWTEVPKSTTLTWWKAGAFTEDKVAVLSDHRGQARWYVLKSGVRPYNSVSITTEEAAGDWVSFTEFSENALTVVAGAVMHPDFKYFKDVRVTVTGMLSADFAFVFDTGGTPNRITIWLSMDTEGLKMELPAGCLMSDAGWGLDEAGKWTAPPGASGGVWQLKAERTTGDTYYVQMIGPFIA